MNAKDLKNSILQLAIQGKLVEQRKEEGTAKILLEKIKAEKEQLIKDKKVRKEKPLPEISEDEIPFDIPESWEWVRLGELITYKNGYAYKSSDMNSIQEGYPVIKSGSIMTLKVVINAKTNYIENPTEKMLDSLIVKNDMLMCLSSQSNNPEPLGKTAIYEFDEPALLNQRVLKMKALLEELIKYLYYTINSQYFHYTVSHQGGGSAQANLKLDHVLHMLIPLPPLEEQKRIVAKIEELKPYVEKYDKAYLEVGELNKKFPEDMQKSILQYAIQGKLVEQREEDGTAEELYEQIKEEKKMLVKEGKVKKPKKLMEITEDEIPYDIPENWKWVRLGDIFEINPRNTVNDDTTVSFIPMTLIEDGYRSEFSYETKSWGEVKKGYTHFREGDIVMAKISPCFQNLKSAIMLNLENGVGAGTTELHVLRAYNDICLEFFLWFIKSPIFVSTCVSKMTGTAGQQRVGTDTITNYVVPLPPLEEQKRIVSKIKEMLPYCKQLVK